MREENLTPIFSGPVGLLSSDLKIRRLCGLHAENVVAHTQVGYGNFTCSLSAGVCPNSKSFFPFLHVFTDFWIVAFIYLQGENGVGTFGLRSVHRGPRGGQRCHV